MVRRSSEQRRASLPAVLVEAPEATVAGGVAGGALPEAGGCGQERGGGVGGQVPPVKIAGVSFHRARFLPGQDNKLNATQVHGFVEGKHPWHTPAHAKKNDG